MRRLVVYCLTDGRVVTRLTIDQQGHRTIDQWATHAVEEEILVGVAPFNDVGLIQTIYVPNNP